MIFKVSHSLSLFLSSQPTFFPHFLLPVETIKCNNYNNHFRNSSELRAGLTGSEIDTTMHGENIHFNLYGRIVGQSVLLTEENMPLFIFTRFMTENEELVLLNSAGEQKTDCV